MRCHLGVVALLDEAKKPGVLATVNDEGGFWETRGLERLTKEIDEQSAALAWLPWRIERRNGPSFSLTATEAEGHGSASPANGYRRHTRLACR